MDKCRNIGRVVCRALTAAFCVPALAGCAGDAAGREPEKEIRELEIMMHLDDGFCEEDNLYLQELEKRLGYRIRIKKVPFNSYNEYLSVVMASDSMPDLVQFNWNGEEWFSSWAMQGRILPVDLEQAEQLKINIQAPQLSLMKTGNDGNVYGVPGVTSKDYYGVIIREDWLETLGLEIPGTKEEYELVMSRFVEEDPDRDFKDNTIGMTSWKLNQFGGVFGGAFQTDYLWNSIHLDIGAGDPDVVLREQQSGYLEMLNYIRHLYEKGLLDPDFETLQNAQERFVQGKIGMIGGFTGDLLQLEKRLQRIEPDAKLTWALPPCDADGKVWNFLPASYGYAGAGSLYGENSVFVITKDADYDLALSFLNEMNTPEMIRFSNLGIEGIHYESYDENRKIVKRTQEQRNRTDRELFGVSDTWRGEPYAFVWDNPGEGERLAYYWKKGSLLITNPKCYHMEISRVGMDFLQNNPFFRETERNNAIAYVTGKMGRQEYEAFIKESVMTRSHVLWDIQEQYRKLTEG